MLETLRKSLTPMRGGIGMIEGSLHPNFAIAHLNWADRYVVRPQVERATAFQIEARVVPMTGQDPVFNAAALERETHVGTSIIQGEDAPAVIDDQDRTMATMHNDSAFRLQVFKAAGERVLLVQCAHERVSLSFFRGAPGTPIYSNIGFARKREGFA
jgi:hypothetical protein